MQTHRCAGTHASGIEEKQIYSEYLVLGLKKYRKHRSAPSATRATSPYSTDSNFSAVVHKPYPKSERKKQLQEQGMFLRLVVYGNNENVQYKTLILNDYFLE